MLGKITQNLMDIVDLLMATLAIVAIVTLIIGLPLIVIHTMRMWP